jgi:hypothetical protein
MKELETVVRLSIRRPICLLVLPPRRKNHSRMATLRSSV